MKERNKEEKRIDFLISKKKLVKCKINKITLT